MTIDQAYGARRGDAGGFRGVMAGPRSAARGEAATDLQRCAQDAAAHWVAVANERFGLRLAVPELRFDLRGRAAGQTVYPARRRGRAVIRINAALLRACPGEMLEETVPHEVAHAATRWIYGAAAKPHGAEWRALMQAFGKAPSVCHALPAQAARRVAYYPYRCACDQPCYLSAIRHRRAKAGRASYRCIRCGAELAYTGGPPRR